MSHTCFGCRQSAIVLGACAFNLGTLSVLHEAYAFPLTSVLLLYLYLLFISVPEPRDGLVAGACACG